MTKKEIRKEILQRRDALSIAERQKASLLMTERIVGHQWYYSSELLFCFASFQSEIDTTMLLKQALFDQKKVYLPCIEEGKMNFYRIQELSELKPGYYGILEPIKDSEIYTYEDKKTPLMIMPGVAFDPKRNRIGYGKGFYDRFLTDKMFHTIAIGYQCQMVDELPCEEHDIKPDQVILY